MPCHEVDLSFEKNPDHLCLNVSGTKGQTFDRRLCPILPVPLAGAANDVVVPVGPVWLVGDSNVVGPAVPAVVALVPVLAFVLDTTLAATLTIDLIRKCRKDPPPRHHRCYCHCIQQSSLVPNQAQKQPRRRRRCLCSRKDLLDILRDLHHHATGWHRASRGSPPPRKQDHRHRRYHRDRWIDSHHGRQCPRRNSKRGSG